MQYFYTLDGTTQLGPVDRNGLKAAGVGPATMIWREGLGDWQPAGNVADQADVFPPRPFGATAGDFPTNPPPVGAPGQMPVRPMNYEPPSPTGGSNGLAIASLICGILGFISACCCPFIISILAVIFGHIARGQIKRGYGVGDGMALAGLVLGYLGIILALANVTLSITGHGLHIQGMPNFPNGMKP